MWNWTMTANWTCVHRWNQQYIHTYIHTYIHIYIYTYIHTYIHIYLYTYIHTYIYTYIHTYIHTTCIHTCIQTYIIMVALPRWSNTSMKGLFVMSGDCNLLLIIVIEWYSLQMNSWAAFHNWINKNFFS